MTTSSFLDWVRYEMQQRGWWTQKELAEHIGLTEGHVSHLFRGNREPGLETYRGLSRAFHVPLETVLRRAGELPRLPLDDDQLERWHGILAQLAKDDVDELYQIALLKVNKSADKRKP